MRLIVFFDLPTQTKAEKRAYTVFRRFLLNDGYDMIQWSVYGRIVNGSDNAETHLRRLFANLPEKGSIRCMQVTEKQFTQIRVLIGAISFQENHINADQMLLF